MLRCQNVQHTEKEKDAGVKGGLPAVLFLKGRGGKACRNNIAVRASATAMTNRKYGRLAGGVERRVRDGPVCHQCDPAARTGNRVFSRCMEGPFWPFLGAVWTSK